MLFQDGIAGRDASLIPLDISAVKALVQAAVNVELFTIPLYMTSLYSLYGTHQITGQNNFYEGRWWPGMSTTANPQTGNEKAFNAIFSVFIAEMLHLQLASNMCTAMGVQPDFNSPALQSSNYGWTCYGPNNTVIPHILDFKDTIFPVNQIKVNLGPVNKEQVSLFLAIEESEGLAEKIIIPSKKSKYFPAVPFANWTTSSTEADLPLFGTIGNMYYCLWEYLSISYNNGTTLWDNVYQQTITVQQDLFNAVDPNSHPMAEYPGMPTTVEQDASAEALNNILNMINGITDQGEGNGVVQQIKVRLGLLQAVQPSFQPSDDALKADYPSYTDTGKSAPSADAAARFGYGAKDHFEVFTDVMAMVVAGQITTWDQWHAKPENKWTAAMLQPNPDQPNPYNLPAAADVAAALNRLKANNTNNSNYDLFSYAAAGAIAGVTTVLNTYWQNQGAGFPFPAMGGTGDRMAICWAVFGQAPNLAAGVKEKQSGILYHACQGMNLDPSQPNDPNNCAAIEVYHTCKGSNTCKAEGGCGFVQNVNGGGTCSSKINMQHAMRSSRYMGAEANKVEGTCSPIFVSAPSDNKCGALGGCAVPISASQVFPALPKSVVGMTLYDFGPAPTFTSTSFENMPYAEGDNVYDTAWKAYTAVLANRKQPSPGPAPAPSDVRLAFPPST